MRRSFILYFVPPPVYFFVSSNSTQPNVTALGWPQTVCKTGSITTFSHSCTSGQDGQTHAKSHKCAFMHSYTHTHTDTQAFICFTGMLQQDIRVLEDQVWYVTWMVNEFVKSQCGICANKIWAAFWLKCCNWCTTVQQVCQYTFV